MMPSFYSQIFNRQYTPQEVEELSLEELYLLADEVYVEKGALAKKWKSIPKRELYLHQDLIEESKRVDLFYVIVRRRIYFLGKSAISHLTQSVKTWKQRAYTLGEKLNMSKQEIKQMT